MTLKIILIIVIIICNYYFNHLCINVYLTFRPFPFWQNFHLNFKFKIILGCRHGSCHRRAVATGNNFDHKRSSRGNESRKQFF